MNRNRLLVLIGAAITLLLPGPGSSGQAAGLARPFAPVVIRGAQLPALLGVQLGEVFVYAFTGGVPEQISFQIDEQDSSGMFVPVGDGLFGSSEELVFLAADAGEFTVDPGLPAGGGIVYPAYVLSLVDPLSAATAYAYIYQSPDLASENPADLISYSQGLDRITSPGVYSTGFNPATGLRDYLTLGAGAADLLDRDKIRVDGYVFLPSIPFSVTEEDVQPAGVHALDGLVRVTRVATSTIDLGTGPVTGVSTSFFYPGLFVQPVSFTTPGSPVNTTYFRFSTDLSPAASGGTYADTNNTNLPVDGVPDVFSASPATDWRSLAFPEGSFTLIAAVPAGLSGAGSYYRDDLTIDPADTGDQMSYGDSGLEIDDPAENQTYSFDLQVYFEVGGSGNGLQHYQYSMNPVQISIQFYAADYNIYLPLVSHEQ